MFWRQRDYTRREPVVLCFVKNWVCRVQLPSGTFSLQNLLILVENRICCLQMHHKSSAPYRVVFVLLKIFSSITLKGTQMQRNAFPASENIEENLDQFKYPYMHPHMDTEISLVFMTI